MNNKKVLFWLVLYVFAMWMLFPVVILSNGDVGYFSVVAQAHVVTVIACAVVLFFSWLSVKAGY